MLLRNRAALHTLPATGLYPHQWSWDSAFTAIGLRHVSPRRAQQELESLLGAQWADGRLPQIVFDRQRDEDYSPGAAFWRSEEIPGSPAVPTAGLVQPPVHARAALAVHRADEAESRRRGFLERAHPRLLAWHGYLRTRRDRGGRGLASIVHPWESGMDNSPAWDGPLSRVPDVRAGGPGVPRPDLRHADPSERPSNAEYGRYLHLAARYRDHRCDDADAGHEFVCEDPAFNALWADAELAMAEVAAALGGDRAPHEARARELTAALEPLFSPALGTYAARDVRTGELQRVATVAGLLPLLLPHLPRAAELLATLRGPRFRLGTAVMVPSHDLTAAGFDRARYWRGPSWSSTTWLLVQALRGRGAVAEARALGAQLRRSALQHGFAEYVDPIDGTPHGTRAFTWTAALALDLELDPELG
ncbi:MGH1-like glycoside hydrolase domain-containing protein [Kineococcus glutinatus]|uniref:MGH1-like glycoside hydrolase domain-containing protein n=1 Tax=Kineococcus glutinatus TaxID=1070872 RepID=UPI0031E5D0FB